MTRPGARETRRPRPANSAALPIVRWQARERGRERASYIGKIDSRRFSNIRRSTCHGISIGAACTIEGLRD